MPRIMIVDDDVIVLTLLKTHLLKMNYEIAGEAVSGNKAIEMAAKVNPDLVLMDIRMPGSFDGIEAAERIIKSQNIPVVFLTAQSDDDSIRKATQVSPYGYILKPFQGRELKAAIEVALNRKDIEDKLQLSEARYRSVVEDQTEIICRFLPDHTITFVNKSFCRQFACTREEIVGQRFLLEFFPETLPLSIKEPVITKEHNIKLPNGENRWFQWTFRAIFNDRNQITEYQTVGLDITQRVLAEKELLRYQNHLKELIDEQTKDLVIAKKAAEAANLAKTEFLGNMSHELRTPMHGILGFARIGLSNVDTADREKIKEYFTKIEKSGERLMLLLEKLLDLSNMEAARISYEMVEYDVFHIISSVISFFSDELNRKEIQIKINRNAGSSIVKCDITRIEQVFKHIISNAIKFTNKGVLVISINEATNDGAGENQSNSNENDAVSTSDSREFQKNSNHKIGSALEIQIADEGIGIPEDELDSIFDRFSQSTRTKTGAGGTGLGLSISRYIVESHGGNIKARNNDRGGATITITLPREPGM